MYCRSRIHNFQGIDGCEDRIDGLLEIGYVFNREIVVKTVPSEDLDLSDTFMIRAGLKF